MINKVKSFARNPLALACLLASTNVFAAVEPASVSASADDGNVPANTTDNNLDTRWSASGDGAWIQYDLGSVMDVESLDIAFFKGDQRIAIFDIATSENGSNWTVVRSGEQDDLTADLQNYGVESEARYVRIIGYGNSSNSWNSITEVDINASSTPTPTPTPTPTTPTPSGDSIRMQAEDYNDYYDTTAANRGGAYRDDSVDIQATSDTGGGYNVGWVVASEYLQFDTDIPEGTYTVQARVASRTVNGALTISTNEGDSLSTSFSATGGWQNWTTVNVGTVTLDDDVAGVTLTMDTSNINVNWIEFVPADGSTPTPTPTPTTPTPTPTPTPVTPTPTPTPTPVTPTPTPTPTPVTPTPSSTFEPVATYYSSADDVAEVLAGVPAGSEVVVTGSGEISIKGLNFSKETMVRAQNFGSTSLENATITDSNNITLQGFAFEPNDESTRLKIVNSTNIQVLRNTFDHTGITESQTTLVMTGASQYITIAYNEFRDKDVSITGGSKITGSFIKTQYDGPGLMSKNVHIHHNHFDNIAPYIASGDSVPAGDSDREAIAMGIADSQSEVTNNIIEYNLFENCDGENEIITVKTSGNHFRYNTFKNSMGSLSFRLGTNNQAYGNYFYGEGSGASVSDDNYETGGIRIYGSGHSVRDNYMEGLTGQVWRRPILIDSGDTSSSIGNDSHQTSSNLDVSNNTIVDSLGGGIHIGGTVYSNMPFNITIDGNTVVGSEGVQFNNVADDSSNLWAGNQSYATGNAVSVDGGSLSSSEVQVLNSAPSISKPSALTASDVGPSAD